MRKRELAPTAIILHHTQDSTKGNQFAKTKRYHVDTLGFGDIGYHGFIERNGQYIQGRALHLRGAHSVSRNKDALGLAFAGDFTKEKPTAAQLTTAARVIPQWKALYPTIKEELLHKQVDNTDCPGCLTVAMIHAPVTINAPLAVPMPTIASDVNVKELAAVSTVFLGSLYMIIKLLK